MAIADIMEEKRVTDIEISNFIKDMKIGNSQDIDRDWVATVDIEMTMTIEEDITEIMKEIKQLDIKKIVMNTEKALMEMVEDVTTILMAQR